MRDQTLSPPKRHLVQVRFQWTRYSSLTNSGCICKLKLKGGCCHMSTLKTRTHLLRLRQRSKLRSNLPDRFLPVRASQVLPRRRDLLAPRRSVLSPLIHYQYHAGERRKGRDGYSLDLPYMYQFSLTIFFPCLSSAILDPLLVIVIS